MKSNFLVAVAAIGVCLFAPKASADILNVTYTGVLTSGFDQNGMFGAPGGNLAGLSYVAHYTFDTSLGIETASPTFHELAGGTSQGATTPIVTSYVTVNGVNSPIIQGTFLGDIYGSTGGISHISRDEFTAENTSVSS